MASALVPREASTLVRCCPLLLLFALSLSLSYAVLRLDLLLNRQTTSRTAVPPVYGIPRGALPLIQLFMHDHQSQGCALAAYDSPGHLFRWILGPASSNAASHTAIYATKVTRRFDIGNLDQYKVR